MQEQIKRQLRYFSENQQNLRKTFYYDSTLKTPHLSFNQLSDWMNDDQRKTSQILPKVDKYRYQMKKVYSVAATMPMNKNNNKPTTCDIKPIKIYFQNPKSNQKGSQTIGRKFLLGNNPQNVSTSKHYEKMKQIQRYSSAAYQTQDKNSIVMRIMRRRKRRIRQNSLLKDYLITTSLQYQKRT